MVNYFWTSRLHNLITSPQILTVDKTQLKWCLLTYNFSDSISALRSSAPKSGSAKGRLSAESEDPEINDLFFPTSSLDKLIVALQVWTVDKTQCKWCLLIYNFSDSISTPSSSIHKLTSAKGRQILEPCDRFSTDFGSRKRLHFWIFRFCWKSCFTQCYSVFLLFTT